MLPFWPRLDYLPYAVTLADNGALSSCVPGTRSRAFRFLGNRKTRSRRDPETDPVDKDASKMEREDVNVFLFRGDPEYVPG